MPSALINMSSKETTSAKMLDPSSSGAIREARESSSHTKASLLDTAKVLGVSISSKSCYDSSKAFTDFAELVSAKLDLSKVRSSRKDRSFIFDFRHMVKVRASVLYSLFLIIIFMSDICSFLEAFLYFGEVKRLNALIKVSLDKAVRQNTVISKNSQKLQEHIVILKKRETFLALWVEELLK